MENARSQTGDAAGLVPLALSHKEQSRKIPSDVASPHNEQFERAVIGGILAGGRAFIERVGHFQVAAIPFFSQEYLTILHAAMEAYDAGDPVAPQTVCAVLERNGQLAKVGGSQGVSIIWADSITAPQDPELFGYYTRELRKLAGDRQRIIIGRKIELLELSASDAIVELEKIGRFEESHHELTIRSASELRLLKIDPHDCLLGDRLLSKGGRMVLAGPAGIGKSRLLFQLAAAGCTGRDWCGIETHMRGLRWLILQTENGNRRLQSEVEALCKVYGESWLNNVFFHTLETDTDGFMAFDNPGAVSAMESVIRKVKPDIVPIDPLRDFIPGNPNDDADMATACTTLSRLCKKDNPDRAIIVLHHARTGKAGAAQAVGFERAGYARNSKVLLSWTRSQVNVAPGTAENNDSLVLACGKLNDGRAFEPFAVRLDPDSMVYSVDDDFDMEQWKVDVGIQSKVHVGNHPEFVADIIRAQGPSTKSDLRAALEAQHGIEKSSAYNLINAAVAKGLVRFTTATKLYELPS